jgi:hypothetical protein
MYSTTLTTQSGTPDVNLRGKQSDKSNAEIHNDVQTESSAKVPYIPNNLKIKKNHGMNDLHVKHKVNDHCSSQYESVLRPWKNIKRAGVETRTANLSPMERWKTETAGDQPWNAVDSVPKKNGVIFEIYQNDDAQRGEWNTWREGLDHTGGGSSMCVES